MDSSDNGYRVVRLSWIEIFVWVLNQKKYIEMKKWNIEKIEKTMLESVYNDKSKMKSKINASIDLYQKSKSDHPEIKNRIEILKQLKEKYQYN